MTEQERLDAFWKAVDEAEQELGVVLGYVMDEHGEIEPAAVALEQVLEKTEIN